MFSVIKYDYFELKVQFKTRTKYSQLLCPIENLYLNSIGIKQNYTLNKPKQITKNSKTKNPFYQMANCLTLNLEY